MTISSKKKYNQIEQGLLLAALTLTSGTVFSADYFLCAGVTTQTMPDTGEVVTMWGFAEDDNADLADGCGTGVVQVPGPALVVSPGDSALNVNLRNDLSEAVSLVIPGQNTAMAPVMFTDDKGRSRVRSFTHETQPAQIGLYQWGSFKPGTYLYQSGTHPAVQIQMGLYGSVVKNNAAGEAYPGITYDNDVIMLYSEIDPVLHNEVANNTYGTASYPSTINYQPRYFLINGEPYNALSTSLGAMELGQTTLIRMLNAGLKTHIPTLQTHIEYVAEDGSPYPYSRPQYSTLLAAGKTKDALFAPVSDGSYSILDSAMALTNGNNASGGMLAFLDVNAATGAPVATGDTYTIVEDSGTFNVAAPGVLDNDTGSAPLAAVLSSPVTSGDLTLNADGSFSYTPAVNFSGGATFSYIANDGAADSNVAVVSIAVTAVNDLPVAVNDSYSTNENTTLNVPASGVLSNDSDADGDVLQAVLQSTTTSGTLNLASDGSFTYAPDTGTSGIDSFTYTAEDGSGASNVVTTEITVVAGAPNVAPVANDDFATTVRTTPVIIDLVGNDTDIDGTVNPASIVIVTQPLRGIITNNGDGTVTYQSRFRRGGTDAFSYNILDDDGDVSNNATVRVNISRR